MTSKNVILIIFLLLITIFQVSRHFVYNAPTIEHTGNNDFLRLFVGRNISFQRGFPFEMKLDENKIP